MSSSLFLQDRPGCLVRLILMVFEIGGRWPYSCCFVRCCHQDLFNIARSILVPLLSRFFFIRLVSSHVVHPYSNIDTTPVCCASVCVFHVFQNVKEVAR